MNRIRLNRRCEVLHTRPLFSTAAGTYHRLRVSTRPTVSESLGWDLNEDEFEVNIAFDQDPDFDELQQRFENGVATIEEATKLLRRNDITTEEFAEYVNSR